VEEDSEDLNLILLQLVEMLDRWAENIVTEA
jgi:hypothetical protein